MGDENGGAMSGLQRLISSQGHWYKVITTDPPECWILEALGGGQILTTYTATQLMFQNKYHIVPVGDGVGTCGMVLNLGYIFFVHEWITTPLIIHQNTQARVLKMIFA